MVPMTDTTTRNTRPSSTPPVAPKRYGYRVRDHFGQHFDDPWDWLRDGEDPEVRAHLEAENAWADTVTVPTREAAARLVEEVKASTALTDVTVPIREGEFWYFRRFAEGQSYATHHRAPVERDEAGAPVPLVPNRACQRGARSSSSMRTSGRAGRSFSAWRTCTRPRMGV